MRRAPFPKPHYVLGDLGLILFLTLPSVSIRAVLFCGIKCVALFFVISVTYSRNRSIQRPHAARATCLLSEDTTTQTRLTISGAASISPVKYVSLTHIAPYPLADTPGGKPKQGFTPRLLSASEDSTLPGTYSLGLVRSKNPDMLYNALFLCTSFLLPSYVTHIAPSFSR